jgi:uncharacterized membrane protein YdjX (TVP38/TMEM64 family)
MTKLDQPSPPRPAAEVPPASRWQRLGHMIRQLGPVGPVALVSATVPALAGLTLLSQITRVASWFRENGPTAMVAYVAAYTLLAGFPVFPTFCMTALGGWAYGFWAGTGLALAGYLGAVMVSYLWLSRIAKNRVVHVLHEHPKWQAVRDGLVGESRRKTVLIVALLRIPPNMPFAVINVVLVSAKVRLRDYCLGSMLGVVPRTVALVYVAASLKKLDWSDLTSQTWLALVGIASTIVCLAIITWLANRALRQITRPGIVRGNP